MPEAENVTPLAALDEAATLADFQAAGFEPFAIGDDAFVLRMAAFTGPLDLILFLTRQHKLDLLDLDINVLLDEYLRWLDRARTLNIDIAAGYLEMAATLAHIKSRLLLPPSETAGDENPDEDDGDPRLDLIRQLLLVQKFQQAARELALRPWLGRDVFVRPWIAADGENPPDPALAAVDAVDLVRLFVEMATEREQALPTREVFAEQISVSERIAELVDRFSGRAAVDFDELFEAEMPRERRIVTFLAVLEMGKLRMVKIRLLPDTLKFRVELGDFSSAPELSAVADDYR